MSPTPRKTTEQTGKERKDASPAPKPSIAREGSPQPAANKVHASAVQSSVLKAHPTDKVSSQEGALKSQHAEKSLPGKSPQGKSPASNSPAVKPTSPARVAQMSNAKPVHKEILEHGAQIQKNVLPTRVVPVVKHDVVVKSPEPGTKRKSLEPEESPAKKAKSSPTSSPRLGKLDAEKAEAKRSPPAQRESRPQR